MRVMIFEPDEASLRVERYGVTVDRVDHHNLGPDMPRSRCDLPERVEQQPRSGAGALARVNREPCQQYWTKRAS